jgi:hypothetical protein
LSLRGIVAVLPHKMFFEALAFQHGSEFDSWRLKSADSLKFQAVFDEILTH